MTTKLASDCKVVNQTGLEELLSELVRSARQDLLAGPGVNDPRQAQHYATAYAFLNTANLIQQIEAHYGIALPPPPQLRREEIEQFALFD